MSSLDQHLGKYAWGSKEAPTLKPSPARREGREGAPGTSWGKGGRAPKRKATDLV